MSEVDPYTIKHLDTWLEAQVHGDTLRAIARKAMLELISNDPEYWGAQEWWNVYDMAKIVLKVSMESELRDRANLWRFDR